VAVNTKWDIVIMAKTKEVATITEAAQRAGLKLASWDAVEAEAKNRLAAAEANTEPGDTYCEIHLCGKVAQGVVKIGNTVLKLSN
jgi:hypothetical protein